MAVISNAVATRGFSKHLGSADASGAPELVAAVAGKSHYLTSLVISSGAAIGITTEDEDTTVLAGPYYMAANTTFGKNFDPPIKVTAAKAIHFDASGAGNVWVLAEGYTE